jgi:hypothetical protein
MTEQTVADAMGTTPRRFDVELFIVHPSLDPVDISGALGLEGHFSHRVGDQRKTPKGTLLSGVYPDTRWRHCIRRAVTEQWFASEVVGLVERLEAHKEFLANVRATGGSASVIIQFLGDGYLADVIPPAALAARRAGTGARNRVFHRATVVGFGTRIATTRLVPFGVKNGGSGLVRRPSGLPSIAAAPCAAVNRRCGPEPEIPGAA